MGAASKQLAGSGGGGAIKTEIIVKKGGWDRSYGVRAILEEDIARPGHPLRVETVNN